MKKRKKDIEDDRPVEILPRVDSEKSRVPTMRRDHCRIIRSSSREKNEDKESNVARREVSKSARMQVDIEPDYCIRLVKKGKEIGFMDLSTEVISVIPYDFDQLRMSKFLLDKASRMRCGSCRYIGHQALYDASMLHNGTLVEDQLTANLRVLMGKHVERWKEEDNERLQCAIMRREGRNYRGINGQRLMDKLKKAIRKKTKNPYCGVCDGVFPSINEYFIHCISWPHFEKIRHGPLFHVSLLISVHEGSLYDDKSLNYFREHSYVPLKYRQ